MAYLCVPKLSRTFHSYIYYALICAFLSLTVYVPQAKAELPLPAPGSMVQLSATFNPPVLTGIKVHPNNPLRFDFILDKGDSVLVNAQLKAESNRLIKYFLASLTIPEKDLWVNLSPYEKDRIVPESFGQTEMGRDLLAQDYILKQITASLIYPEDEIGKQFWKRIYEDAAKKFGATTVPVNTFNKVWIVPEKAVVYENAEAGTAYVVNSKLKVMLEQDYLSLQRNTVQSKQSANDVNALGSQVVREIVIPQLTKEVNEGKNFAQLRQVYHSLILADWYKQKIKGSILSKVYADQSKVAGIVIGDPKEKQRIYEQYLEAFKKGAYNYIKEEIDAVSQKPIPRKYFSGGFAMSLEGRLDIVQDEAMMSSFSRLSGAHIINVLLRNAADHTPPAPVGTQDARSVHDLDNIVRNTVAVHRVDGSDMHKELFMRYSKFKHGSLKEMSRIAGEVGDKIAQDWEKEIQMHPDDWVIVSSGASRVVGELVAKRFGVHYLNLERTGKALFKFSEYGSLPNQNVRMNVIRNSLTYVDGHYTFSMTGKKVILVDDMLSSGATLRGYAEFLEREFKSVIRGSYVFISINENEDLSLEDKINLFMLNEGGAEALIQMINQEETVVTKYTTSALFLDRRHRKWKNFLMLSPEKRNMVIRSTMVFLYQRTAGIWKNKSEIETDAAMITAEDAVKSRTPQQLAVPFRAAIDDVQRPFGKFFEHLAQKLFLNSLKAGIAQWFEETRFYRSLSRGAGWFRFREKTFYVNHHLRAKKDGSAEVVYKVWAEDPLYFIEFTVEDIKSLSFGIMPHQLSKEQIENMFFPPVDVKAVIERIRTSDNLTRTAHTIANYHDEAKVLSAIAADSGDAWAAWIALGRLHDKPRSNRAVLKALTGRSINGIPDFIEKYRTLNAELDQLLLSQELGYKRSDIRMTGLNRILKKSTDNRLDFTAEKFVLLLNHSLYPEHRNLLPILENEILPLFVELQHPLTLALSNFDEWLAYSVGGYHTEYSKRAVFLSELKDHPWASALLFAGNGPHTRYLYDKADIEDIEAQPHLINGFIGTFWDKMQEAAGLVGQGRIEEADAVGREIKELAGALLNGLLVQSELTTEQYLNTLDDHLSSRQDLLPAVLQRAVALFPKRMPDFLHYVDGLFGNEAADDLAYWNQRNNKKVTIRAVLTGDTEDAKAYRDRIEQSHRRKSYSERMLSVKSAQEMYAAIRNRFLFSVRQDAAMNAVGERQNQTGGIDLTRVPDDLSGNENAGIQFHIDPVQLHQLQQVPGFIPVIVNIQPISELRPFLGLTDS